MEIQKYKGKRLTIIIDKKGEILVKAPFFITEKQIYDFLEEKKNWIEKKQKEALERRERENPYRILHDNKVEILWNLEAINIKKGDIFINEEALNKYLKEKARHVISFRIELLSEKMNLYPKSIRITSARTRWGSCNVSKGLNFSYRLMFAPIEVIDYVIIHEMCHIAFMNHSKDFWNLVYEYCPNFKEYKKWLKLNNNIMDEEI